MNGSLFISDFISELVGYIKDNVLRRVYELGL